MQRPLASRKRAAPGASPPMQQQKRQQQPSQQSSQQSSQRPQQQQQQIDQPNTTDGQYVDWAQVGDFDQYGDLVDPSTFDGLTYDNGSLAIGDDLGNDASLGPASSGQLVRRNANQQLATISRQPWQEANEVLTVGPDDSGWHSVDEDEPDLKQRALEARREAQSKRKQIPPFVQKLSSFLDESKNTDLIRWSDDGRSFIVIDEEEFAKTLIPELFKHNNYASFVRQLNMYGFHKKVGLTDNSMKASENKRKTPSEYFNHYFRRGRPELLWLIQKPKAPGQQPPTKREGKPGESVEDDQKLDPAGLTSPTVEGGSLSQNRQDVAVIPKSELAGLRQELATLQRQQKMISTVIGQMKRQNDEMYQQASAFRAMHDRHASSINAILTFLASFYHRTLEGQNNPNPNIADMFANTIPQAASNVANVVDMGDFPDVELDMGPPRNRRRLLLPAPESNNASSLHSPTSPVTLPPSTRSTASPKPRSSQTPIFRTSDASLSGSGDNILPTGPPQSPPPNVKPEVETPNGVPDAPDIMSVINAANASNQTAASGNNMDFNSALEHVQTAGGNLTDQQRSDMLDLMVADANASNGSSSQIQPAQALSPSSNNNPPSFLNLPSPPPQDEITAQQNSLDWLQKVLKEKSNAVQNLAEKLGPLSPNGYVPRLNDANVPPPLTDWNLDDWINNEDGYFGNAVDIGSFDPNAQNLADLDDIGLGLDDSNNLAGISSVDTSSGRVDEYSAARVENLSSRGVSPAVTVETLEGEGENAIGGGEEETQGRTPRKRRRRY